MFVLIGSPSELYGISRVSAQLGLAEAVCAMRALRFEYNAQKAALFAKQSRGTREEGLDVMSGQSRAPELVMAIADVDALQ